MFSNGLLHNDILVLADQQKLTSISLCGHWVLSRRLPKSDSRKEGMVKERKGNLICRHNVDKKLCFPYLKVEETQSSYAIWALCQTAWILKQSCIQRWRSAGSWNAEWHIGSFENYSWRKAKAIFVICNNSFKEVVKIDELPWLLTAVHWKAEIWLTQKRLRSYPCRKTGSWSRWLWSHLSDNITSDTVRYWLLKGGRFTISEWKKFL